MLIHEVNESNFEEERTKGEFEVNKKFDEWDRLGRQSLSIDEFKKKSSLLFRDPTIWAYANLRDKQKNPLKFYYFQDKIINDNHRFIHVSAANQIGKTWALQVKILHHSLYTPFGSAMLISKSEDQAKRILDEIKWMMRYGRINLLDEFTDEVANRFELHLEGPNESVSTINVFPPTTAILGFPATLICKDETGFWEKEENMNPIEYYQQCVEPRTNTTKSWKHDFLTMGQIVSITNPNGQDGLAWWLYNNPKYHQYLYNWLAKPENSLKEYKEAEETINPYIFASTYSAKYVIASGGFISLAQYVRFKEYDIPLVIPPGSILFLGGDFASEEPKSKGTDWHVLYGVIPVENKMYPAYPRIRVVYMKEFPPGTSREEIYHEIETLKNLPNVTLAKFSYDRVGVSDAVKNDLIGMGLFHEEQIEDLTYSLKNKSDIYLNFQTLFLQDMIEGSDISKLQEQLLALKVERPTGSSHIKVHHKTEGIKDDHPDALANACFSARNAGYVPVSFSVVRRTQAVDEVHKNRLIYCDKCKNYHWDTEECYESSEVCVGSSLYNFQN